MIACNRSAFLCVPDTLSSTNKQGLEPCKLIFGETDYSIFQWVSSPCLFPQYLF